jgi:hypothetical protein
LILITFHLLSARIGGNADVVKVRLKQKIDEIEACTELLKGLSGWNDPLFVPKTPPDPTDPVIQDRIDKTDTLYLNGISISDSSYDAVKYTYGDPPKVGYSSLPVEAYGGDKGNGTQKLVVGQLYDYTKGNPDARYFVFLGQDPKTGLPAFTPAKSPLTLKTQSGTDFGSLTPGDLVKDLDTGRYYRVSNDKTGVEVSGFPLQKFVLSPDSSVVSILNAQINQKITAASDLSKADSLDMQKLQGHLGNVTTMSADLLGSVSTLGNSIANKI